MKPIRKKFDWEKRFRELQKSLEANMPESYITRINDDCLFEIYKYLNRADIVNLSLTCSHFSNFAQTNFYRKDTKMNFDQELRMFGSAEFDHPKNHIDIYRQIIRFGPTIKQLSISTLIINNGHNNLLQAIVTYCTALEELEIYSFTNLHGKTVMPENLVCNIKSLTLICGNNISDNFGEFLQRCPKLKKLIISSNDFTKGKIFQLLHSLTELHIMSESKLENLNVFSINQNLHTLTMNNCYGLSSECYCQLSKWFPRLKQLSIDLKRQIDVDRLIFIANLEYLRYLRIICTNHKIFNISEYLQRIDDSNCIEELEISLCILDVETLYMFNKFNKLKMLKITSNPDRPTINMLDIISECIPQLEILHCVFCESINDYKIIEFVKSCRQLNKLIIRMCLGGIAIKPVVFALVKILKEENLLSPTRRQRLQFVLDPRDLITTNLEDHDDVDKDINEFLSNNNYYFYGFDNATKILLYENADLLIITKYDPVLDESANLFNCEEFTTRMFDYKMRYTRPNA